jgi:hypothetical protein
MIRVTNVRDNIGLSCELSDTVTRTSRTLSRVLFSVSPYAVPMSLMSRTLFTRERERERERVISIYR